jgi:hypothetical protein
VIYEYVANLHSHSLYSDGHATHDQIAMAAIEAGLDLVAVTDHNVLVQGLDGYRYRADRRVLLVTGQEVHDAGRDPQANHLLVFEAGPELARFAPEPLRLLREVQSQAGLAFAAHPHDPAATSFDEPGIPWLEWDLEGLTGLELWNFMSEFKGRLTSRLQAVYYAYRPQDVPRGPHPNTLAQWDTLLAAGRKMVAIGNADAHGLPAKLGPLRRELFPYQFLFGAINTHLLCPQPLSGQADADRQALFTALRRGNCFVANDLAFPSRGFRFTGQSDLGSAMMGDSLRSRYGAALQVRAPQRAHLRLIRNGQLLQEWPKAESAVITVTEPGAYRAEAHLQLPGGRAGWIYSNPIYLELATAGRLAGRGKIPDHLFD